MGWEWRIFYENGPDALSVLEKNQIIEAKPEQRTDTYQLLGHAGFGLKVRGGTNSNLHELKIRLEKRDDGWERWMKRYIDSSSPKSVQVRAILSKLEHESSSSCLQAFLDQTETTATVEKHIRVDKKRIQFYRQDAVMEQTDLIVRSDDGTCLAASYRTICVEGNPESVLPKQILSKFDASAKSTVIVGGYPEFLERLFAS